MGNHSEELHSPARPAASMRPGWRKLPAGIAAALAWVLFTGCGDVYRPVANPILKPAGDPAQTHLALVVSSNGGGSGSATSIDISGDTNIGNFPVGHGAVFGAFSPSTAQALVANRDDDSVSLLSPSLLGSLVTTITLPPGSAPVYLASTQPGFMFVANSGGNSVGVIALSLRSQQLSIPVGRTPVALAQTPDTNTLYSVNRGDGTVSAISRVSDFVVATIPVGSSPVAAAMNSDGKTLYVANQGSGTISVIDVASNTVTATLPTGGSPRTMAFDPHLRRLYVANTGSNTISVFSADFGLTLLGTVTVGNAPTSIAPLADGSRVYVANSGCADPVNLTGCSGNTVSVVDPLNLTVLRTITVGSTPVALAADPQSTRVVVANRDSNNISSIRTSDDTVVATNASGAPQPVFVTVSQ